MAELTLTGAAPVRSRLVALVAGAQALLGRDLRVGSPSPIAAYLNHGTAPHVIRPRSAGGALRFEVQGRTVFARSVRHPGTRALRFFERGLAASRPAVAQELARSLAAVATGAPPSEVVAGGVRAARAVREIIRAGAPRGTGPHAGALIAGIDVYLDGRRVGA